MVDMTDPRCPTPATVPRDPPGAIPGGHPSPTVLVIGDPFPSPPDPVSALFPLPSPP